jgi:signal transduction histidine kinase
VIVVPARVFWSRRRDLLADGVLAAVVAALDVGQAMVAGFARGEPRLTAVGVVLLLAQGVPLVWRRRAPVPVWLVTGAAAAGYGIGDYPDRLLPLGPLVALYTVVQGRSRRVVAVIAVMSLALAEASAAAAGDSDARDYLFGALLVGLTVVLAEQQRTRRAYLAEVEARAAQLAQARDAEGRHAVQDERVRIARELHDVVAHHVSMVVVQAEAASVAATPAVRTALEAIADTARSALMELRRLLGVLRNSDDRVALAPQPGIAQLNSLVRQVSSAGLPVELRMEGEMPAVPAGIDLSVFRIVQEALTNALRHAGPARACVTVRYRGDHLEVEVVDDGAGTGDQPAAGAGPGHGLLGIGERVAMFDGVLHAGPRPEGGFAVVARLPVRG